ncbi:MAG: hypothetical protein VKO21_06000 [Candidatus Sericytochromatia bacterium]|nr:hypothetical protein [Candidatus Sericytochromatia bacterium]
MRLFLAFVAVVFLPEVAEACTVCPLGSERNGQAYIVAGVLVSVVQFTAAGVLVYWLRKNNRREA